MTKEALANWKWLARHWAYPEVRTEILADSLKAACEEIERLRYVLYGPEDFPSEMPKDLKRQEPDDSSYITFCGGVADGENVPLYYGSGYAPESD